jgi:tetratricopeptide (TPR) repeat protein
MATHLFNPLCLRRSLVLATLLLSGFAAGPWESAAQAQAAAGKPAAPAKKPPGKAKTPEWHGEAAPREVVPGEKVLAALIELGTQRMAAGRYDEALKAFSDAVQRAPLEPRPLYLRGACYQKMNRLPAAEADFRAALKLDPTGADEQSVKVRAELGAVLTDSNRAAEAIEVLELAVKAKPDLFESQYNLGVAHEALKHWPQAIAAYTRATKLKPTDANPRANQADAQLNLAVSLRRAGRIEDALGPAREAMQLAPDRPHPHLNLGLLLSDAKRYDESVAELMAATQLAESQYKTGTTAEEREDGKQMLHKAFWRLGVVHIRREQAAPAVAALEQAKAIEATPEVLTDLGLARRKAGDIARAEVEFRAALKLNPKLQSARLHLVSTLTATSRCDEGLKELALLTPDPQYTETVNRIKARCDYERQLQKPKK